MAPSVIASVQRSARASLCSFRTLPRCVADELVQEAMARTFFAPNVRDPVRFAGRVGRRLAIDWLRRCREVDAPIEAAEASPWAARMEASLDLARVCRLIEEAPPGHRRTLTDLVLAEGTVEEASAAWGCARDASYKRRRRAIDWMRRRVSYAASL